MKLIALIIATLFLAINSYADIKTRADEFFNQEDIENQSTDYPNLGILSDVGVSLRLLQSRSNALKKLDWAIEAELSDKFKKRRKLEKLLANTDELLLEQADKWPEEQLDAYRKNKANIEHQLFVQNEEIVFQQKKMLTSLDGFKHSRYQNIAKRQMYVRKFAIYGIVLTLVDLTGQFITDIHSPGENDHILGSGLWEFLEVAVENTYGTIDEIFEDEKIQNKLDQKLKELENQN